MILIFQCTKVKKNFTISSTAETPTVSIVIDFKPFYYACAHDSVYTFFLLNYSEPCQHYFIDHLCIGHIESLAENCVNFTCSMIMKVLNYKFIKDKIQIRFAKCKKNFSD